MCPAPFSFKVASVLMLIGAVSGCSSSLPTRVTPGWSDSGELGFSTTSAKFGRGPGTVSDCSDDRFYCARGGDFDLVLPRSCDDIEMGAVFETGGVRSEVLYRLDYGLRPHGESEFFWIGNADRPHIVFTYSKRQGLRSVIQDPNMNLVAMVRSGELPRANLDRHPRRVEFSRLESGRVGVASQGRCA